MVLTRLRKWRATLRESLTRAPRTTLRVSDLVAAPPAAVTAAAAALDLPEAEPGVAPGHRPWVVVCGLAAGTLTTIEQVPTRSRRRTLQELDVALRQLGTEAVRRSDESHQSGVSRA